MPGETLAMGWLNEIDALATIRHRIMAVSRITGWDVFTFHTLHNADHYFDTTIGAIRDTWMKEGNLSTAAHHETKRLFGNPYDYHRIHARLIENLVFQSSLLDWVDRHASGLPLRLHVIGTALLSALVSAGSISVLKFGTRWDEWLRGHVNAGSEDEVGWARFEQVLRTIEGRSPLSFSVARADLPKVGPPVRPFWYSSTTQDEPILITTGQDAAAALETMNISSWAFSSKPGHSSDEPVRGWLASPLHPMATICKWSVSNYLLATPTSVSLFLDHIATIGRAPALCLPPPRTRSESLPAVENESHRPLIR
jgi:hypothetical protein